MEAVALENYSYEDKMEIECFNESINMQEIFE